jgi:hypothetical protein
MQHKPVTEIFTLGLLTVIKLQENTNLIQILMFTESLQSQKKQHPHLLLKRFTKITMTGFPIYIRNHFNTLVHLLTKSSYQDYD